MKLITENETLYEHAIFRRQTTGEPFDLWIDEFGKDRKVSHNEPRFKVSANDVELDIILHSDDTIEIVNNKRDIQKFKYAKEATKLIKDYREALRAHWNHDIDTGDLAMVFKLTKKDRTKILDILSKIASENV